MEVVGFFAGPGLVVNSIPGFFGSWCEREKGLIRLRGSWRNREGDDLWCTRMGCCAILFLC